jgi:hypothetical protein
MSQESYTNFLAGLGYSSIYDSGTVWQIESNIPLQSKNGIDVAYYVVLQNPNNVMALTTFRAGISYEMAFLGSRIIELASRIPIVAIISAAILLEAKRRNFTGVGIHHTSQHFLRTATAGVSEPPSEPEYEPRSIVSNIAAQEKPIQETRSGSESTLQIIALPKMPDLLGYYLVEASKSVEIPMIVTGPETASFDIDVNEGTIDLHVFKEARFIALNEKGYSTLHRGQKIFNASYSTTVHSARGLEWTPKQPGKYFIVLDNSSNANLKRCTLDYSYSKTRVFSNP